MVALKVELFCLMQKTSFPFPESYICITVQTLFVLFCPVKTPKPQFSPCWTSTNIDFTFYITGSEILAATCYVPFFWHISNICLCLSVHFWIFWFFFSYLFSIYLKKVYEQSDPFWRWVLSEINSSSLFMNKKNPKKNIIFIRKSVIKPVTILIAWMLNTSSQHKWKNSM